MNSSLSSLPTEYLINQLLLLSIDDLVNICQTNSRLNNICKNDYFWEQKAHSDFGSYVNYKNEDETWR